MAFVGTAEPVGYSGISKTAEKLVGTIRFKVTVDAVTGPITIMQAPGLPADDDPWSYYGETDPTLLHTKKAPVQGKTYKTWYVDCLYEFNLSGGGSAQDKVPGGPDENPANQLPYLVPGFIPYQETIKDAEFVAVFTLPYSAEAGKPDGWDVGSRRPVSNSAGVPLIPAPERQKFYEAIRLVGQFPSWPAAFVGSIGKTNSDTISVTFTRGGTAVYSDTFNPDELKLVSVSPNPTTFNEKFWYEITAEFHINRTGWFLDILDEGFEELVKVGDDDGFGGQWVAGDFDEATPFRPIKGATGVEVPEKKLLDGDGGVGMFTWGGASIGPPVPRYIRYRDHYQKALNPIINLYGF